MKEKMKRSIIIPLIAAILTAWTIDASAQKYVPTPVTVSKEKVKLNGKVYLSHVVLERQTLYGISSAYGVSVEELYEANPTLRETGLQKNSILLVPLKEKPAEHQAARTATPPPSDEGKYTTHTVKWYEDIEGIAKNYGVSVKAIMEANGLSSKKLTTRQVLRIPLAPSTPVEETLPEESPESEPVAVQPESPQKDTIVPLPFPRESTFSLILPFRAESGGSELNMDFYSGALMAVKDLKDAGYRVRLNTFDLMAGLPSGEELLSQDFIVGPVASRDLEAVLDRVQGKVPVISPLDQKAVALASRYSAFIQAPTPADRQLADLAKWVKEDRQQADSVILVTEKGASSAAAASGARSAMASEGVVYYLLSYSTPEGLELPAKLEQVLTLEGTNRVVVASDNEAFVDDVVRNLGIMQGKGYSICLYAASKVRGFESIDQAALHRLNLHVSNSYYADYTNAGNFLAAYRALFNTEPSQFAIQGYDTVMFFARRSCIYGAEWPRSLDKVKENGGIHTDFLFMTGENGSYVNTAVRRAIYETDYSSSLVR